MEKHIQKQIKELWANKKSGHDFQIKTSICGHDLAMTEDGKYHLAISGGTIMPLKDVIGQSDETIKADLADIEAKTPTPKIASLQRFGGEEWSAKISGVQKYDCPKGITSEEVAAYFDQEHRIMQAMVIDQMRDFNLPTGKDSHLFYSPDPEKPMTDEHREIWEGAIAKRQAFDMAENPHNQRLQEMGITTPSPLKIADPATPIDQNSWRGTKMEVTDALYDELYKIPPHPDDAGAVLDEPAPKKRERDREKGIDID